MSSPPQSHAWAHNLVFRWKAQRKARTEMGREKEAQGLGMPHTASPTTWPSFAPINLKAERFWARKSTELKRAAGKVW